jgi:hypothetical protein
MYVALSDVIIYLDGKMLNTAAVDSVYKPLFIARWFIECNTFA